MRSSTPVCEARGSRCDDAPRSRRRCGGTAKRSKRSKRNKRSKAVGALHAKRHQRCRLGHAARARHARHSARAGALAAPRKDSRPESPQAGPSARLRQRNRRARRLHDEQHGIRSIRAPTRGSASVPGTSPARVNIGVASFMQPVAVHPSPPRASSRRSPARVQRDDADGRPVPSAARPAPLAGNATLTAERGRRMPPCAPLSACAADSSQALGRELRAIGFAADLRDGGWGG